MAGSVDSLEARIRAILTAPDTDLATISAKRVRKLLVEEGRTLSEEFIRENKSDIDLLIARVYEQAVA
ncbi:hypothetical protein B0H21DRAFT_659088, partial [Amylocystis lapponica]